MRALEITGHVIFKLRYDWIYQKKTTIVCNSEIMVATKIYKKCSPHGRLYLYLGQRDFISSDGLIEDIKGIAYTPELSEIQGE